MTAARRGQHIEAEPDEELQKSSSNLQLLGRELSVYQVGDGALSASRPVPGTDLCSHSSLSHVISSFSPLPGKQNMP